MDSKLVFAIDAGRFRAFRLEDSIHFSNPRLRRLESWQTEVNRRISEQVTDKAGQFSKNALSFASVNDMADGERHNLSLERRRRAIKKMADRIRTLMDEEGADRCYLAASREVNPALMEALHPSVLPMIEKNIVANLARLNSSQLARHLANNSKTGKRKEWLQPTV